MGVSTVRPARRLRPRALAVVALTGAALGTGWDMLHVQTGTTVYAFGADRLPWWVPVEFAVVYVVGVLGFARFGRPAPDERTPVRLVGEVAWLSAVYAMTAILHRHEIVVALVALPMLAVRSRTLTGVVRSNPIPAAMLIAGGPVVESVLVGADVFRYTQASLGGVPLWLPLLYANAVPFAVRLAEAALRVSGPAARPLEPIRERAS